MTKDEAIEKLAEDILNSWDMDDLLGFAFEKLQANLQQLDDQELKEEWYHRFEEELDLGASSSG